MSVTQTLDRIEADVITLMEEVRELKRHPHEHVATKQEITVGCVVALRDTSMMRLIVHLSGGYAALALETGAVMSSTVKYIEELVSHYEYVFVAASLEEYYASKVT